jgi:hypothetical protein
LGIKSLAPATFKAAGNRVVSGLRVAREMHKSMKQTDAEFERLSWECPCEEFSMEMQEIEQRIASDQLIGGVPWDWVVINGRMARCINPFVDLPDAADGWKSVQGRSVCEEEPRVSRQKFKMQQ